MIGKKLAKVVRFPANSEVLKALRDHEEWQAKKRARFAAIKFAARYINEKLFPEGTRFSCDDWGMTLYVPWSKENMGQARGAIGAGWKVESQYKDDSGTLSRRYGMKVGDFDVEISIVLDSQKLVEGSCRRIVVSEEVVPSTYTRKVYKVICDDGTETFETTSPDQDVYVEIDHDMTEVEAQF